MADLHHKCDDACYCWDAGRKELAEDVISFAVRGWNLKRITKHMNETIDAASMRMVRHPDVNVVNTPEYPRLADYSSTKGECYE